MMKFSKTNREIPSNFAQKRHENRKKSTKKSTKRHARKNTKRRAKEKLSITEPAWKKEETTLR